MRHRRRWGHTQSQDESDINDPARDLWDSACLGSLSLFDSFQLTNKCHFPPCRLFCRRSRLVLCPITSRSGRGLDGWLLPMLHPKSCLKYVFVHFCNKHTVLRIMGTSERADCATASHITAGHHNYSQIIQTLLY